MKLKNINENLKIDPQEVVTAFLAALNVAKAKSDARKDSRKDEPYPEKGGPAASRDPEGDEFRQKFHSDQDHRENVQRRDFMARVREGGPPDDWEEPTLHRQGEHGRQGDIANRGTMPGANKDALRGKTSSYPTHPGQHGDKFDPEYFAAMGKKKFGEGGIGGGSLGAGINRWDTKNPVSYEDTLDEKEGGTIGNKSEKSKDSFDDSPFAKIVDKWLEIIGAPKDNMGSIGGNAPSSFKSSGSKSDKKKSDSDKTDSKKSDYKAAPSSRDAVKPKNKPSTINNVDKMRPSTSSGSISNRDRPTTSVSGPPKHKSISHSKTGLSFPERLSAFMEEMGLDNPQLNEISKGERARLAAAAKHAESERKRIEAEKIAKNNKRVDTRMANKPKRLAKKLAPKGAQDADFTSILQRQHQEQEPEPIAPKASTVSIPYHGWDIKYRPSTDDGPVEWSVSKGNKLLQTGEAASDKEAVGAAENWIKMNAGNKGSFNKNATIDFNSKFAQMFTPSGESVYATFISQDGQPHIIMSDEPHEGLQKTATSRRAGYNFPSITAGPKVTRPSFLQPHGRYVIDVAGKEELDDPGVFKYPLIFQGIVHDKTERSPMSGPGFSVAYARDEEMAEAIDPWHGYTQDDPKYKSAVKKGATMRGSPEVPFSELVCDTIRKHGIRWAFNYYVKERNLPPRMFKIYAKDALENP